MALEFTKSEAKQWAREHYKGLEGIICPSFTPDLAELDEDGELAQDLDDLLR